MSSSPPRISYLALDAWRGIASMMVVLYHTAGVHQYHHKELKETPLFRLMEYGWLGVQLFFVVSGFCIANAAIVSLSRDSGVTSFFMARLRRIFPPYWCAFLLYLLVLKLLATLGEQGMGEAMSPGVMASNLTLAQVLLGGPSILPVSWTLCYELAFYILVGATLGLVGRKWGARALLRGLHLLTLGCVLALFGPRVPYPFNLWPHFGLGILVYDLLTAPKAREPRLWALVIVVAMLILVVMRDYLIYVQPLRLSTLVALVFAAALVGLHRFDAKIGKWRALAGLSAVGSFSYSLYLTHHYILRVGLQVFDKLHPPDPGGIVGVLFGTLGCILFAAIFYRCCERPFLKKRSAP